MTHSNSTADLDLTPTELLRRMNNIVRFGTVAEVRLTPPARCRIKSGDVLTDWLPWSTLRAGKATVWWPPTKGEQVVLLSPGGDLASAIVIPASFCDAIPQSSVKAEEMRIHFDNGDSIVHNSATGSLAMRATKRISLTAAEGIDLRSDTEITLSAADTTWRIAAGRTTTNQDVVAQGISAVHHRHRDVKSGTDRSGEPG